MPCTKEGIIKVQELLNTGFVYAGGDFDSHKNYWPIFARSYGLSVDKLPKFKSKCVCGEEITRNCWVYNPKTRRMKVIGSDCIKKFGLEGRKCSVCNVVHRNRLVNRCNDCRKGLCDICNKKISLKYNKCYRCTYN